MAKKVANKEFEKQILDNLKTLIVGSQKVAVALSGGSDSLALTIALHNLGFEVLAILINHNLRKEAKDEIKTTIATLEKMGIKYVVKEWDGRVQKNLEAEARKNRYSLLLEVCRESRVETLCIGHHIDDQVETFLLNLARGSGLDGLCAMPKTMDIDGVKIVRPMLNLTKQNCRDYLTKLGLKWCEDASNKDTKYKRNNIRKLLENIENVELLTRRIAKTTEILQEARETLEYIVESEVLKFKKINNKSKIGYFIDIDEFLKNPKYIQRSLISKIAVELFEREYKFRFYQIDLLLDLIAKKESFKRSLGSGFVELKKGIISIFVENKK